MFAPMTIREGINKQNNLAKDVLTLFEKRAIVMKGNIVLTQVGRNAEQYPISIPANEYNFKLLINVDRLNIKYT